MVERLPPNAIAKKLVRMLRPQHPDYHYLKKVFQHARELLDVTPRPQPKRLPDLLTDAELGRVDELRPILIHVLQTLHMEDNHYVSTTYDLKIGG